MPHLVRPTEQFRDSYRSLVSEFVESGEKLIPFTLQIPSDDFLGYLAELHRSSRGIGMDEGFVAHSTFWLVKDEAEVVAVSNLRHGLTDRLRKEGGSIGYGVRPSARGNGYGSEVLKQTLEEATALGLKEVLLTCSETNVASISVILRNGGRFDTKEYLAEQERTIHRYWITL